MLTYKSIESTDHGVAVLPEGETKLGEFSAGPRLHAELLTRTLDIGPPSFQPERRTSNCTYSARPCVLVESLEISVNGRPIDVPRSAFDDLSDVGRAHLLRLGRRRRFKLTMLGGDASEGYEVSIVFDDRRVLGRTIIAGEAGVVAERTTYSDLSKAFR